MGRASSSKKVARAARAGRTAGTRERRAMGFPIAIALVVILGVVLVAWARTQRETSAPTLRDHWHAAYGVYVCEAFLDPFTTENDPDGIHSHADGLIHIHPFGSSVTGDGATLDVFFVAMQASFDDAQLIMPDGTVYSEENTDCNGEPAMWQVARWSTALDTSGPPEITTEDLADTRFLGDGEAFTIALVPEGAEIPPPPSAQSIADVSDVVSDGPVTDLGDGTATTVAGDGSAPSSTVAGDGSAPSSTVGDPGEDTPASTVAGG